MIMLLKFYCLILGAKLNLLALPFQLFGQDLVGLFWAIEAIVFVVLGFVFAMPIVRKEGCTSVNGYEADVSRHKCVHVTGYDENGKSVSWEAKNWNARMVQHEMDHLDGILFTDKMYSPESLSFKYWKTVNAKNGEFRLHFGGLPGWKQYYYVLPILVSIPLYIAYDIWLYS